MVSLTDTISTSAAFAERTGQEIDPDQEMIGIGTANAAAGVFQGFPVSTSGSRGSENRSASAFSNAISSAALDDKPLPTGTVESIRASNPVSVMPAWRSASVTPCT